MPALLDLPQIRRLRRRTGGARRVALGDAAVRCGGRPEPDGMKGRPDRDRKQRFLFYPST